MTGSSTSRATVTPEKSIDPFIRSINSLFEENSPMRVWLLSDIHHHAGWPFEAPAVAPDADVIVIAGDVTEELGRRALPWIADTFLRYDIPVIYIPGNHDFYGAHLDFEVRKAQLVAEHHGIHLLATGQSVVIADTRFVGATVWNDFDLGRWGHFAEQEAIKWMVDYRRIRTGSDFRRALPKDTIAQHYAQRHRIEQLLSQPFDGPTVVVTHHAPLERSLQKGRAETELDAAYVSDLTEVIEKFQPELWLHGHIHVSHDYRHDQTRVVTNPRGYLLGHVMSGRGHRYPENPLFDPAFVIEVEPRPKPIVKPA
jgi:Icc-related predicted phosphoesterase